MGYRGFGIYVSSAISEPVPRPATGLICLPPDLPTSTSSIRRSAAQRHAKASVPATRERALGKCLDKGPADR